MGRTRALGWGLLVSSALWATPAVGLASEDVNRHISFCGEGGGEGEDLGSDRLYEIEEKIDLGELRQARRMLVAGLRRGRFRQHVRGLAIGAWAEVELRLGHYARAVPLYRRAMRAQDASGTDPLHVGLAIALYRSRRAAQGRAEAQSFADAACPTDGAIDDPVACYGARMVLAMTEPTPETQAPSLETARAIRTAEPRLEESFAEMASLFPGVAPAVATGAAAAATPEPVQPPTVATVADAAPIVRAAPSPTTGAAASTRRDAPRRPAVAAR